MNSGLDVLFKARFPIWESLLNSENESDRKLAIACKQAFAAGYEECESRVEEIVIDHMMAVRTPNSIFKDVNGKGGVKECFARGLDTLESKLWGESSSELLKEYELAFSKYSGPELNWTLTMSQVQWIRLLCTAKEYSIPSKSLAQWCIAKGCELG